MKEVKINAIHYFEEFRPFFEKMSLLMAENDFAKGDSWKTTCSTAYLLDRLIVQIEDMQNDPEREDYYANLANYCAMLWFRDLQDSTEDGERDNEKKR